MNAKWICISVAVIGCLLMVSGWASAGFSFENLFSDRALYTEVSHTESLGANDTVEIKTDVEIVRVDRSADDKAHISYFDSEKKKHLYTYDGGTLSIGVDNAGRKWYDYISFNFAICENAIEVLLPSGFQGKLRVVETTGKGTVENIQGLEKIDLSVTTGDLSVSDCAAKELRLSTTTGYLKASEIQAYQLSAESTTGGISLSGVKATALSSRFATGGVAVSNADCDTIDVHGTTGSIKIDGIVANGIALSTSTGSISGSIARAAREFTVSSATATGRNNLQNLGSGGARKLNVKSTTGNIDISFAD